MRASHLFVLAALTACNTARSAEPPARRAASATADLGGWFPIASAECRVDALTHHLVSEPPRRSDVRASRDVRTLSVLLACRDPRGAPVDAEAVLARGVSVALLGPDGRTHPPRVDAHAPAPPTESELSFALDRDEPLARARYVFDARSGEPQPTEAPGSYTLHLSTGRERVEVRLRAQHETPAFSAFVGRVARALATNEGLDTLAAPELAAELGELQRTVHEAGERYGPHRLRAEATPEADALTLTIHLEELARPAQLAEPLAIHVRVSGDPPRVTGVQSAASLRHAVRCATLQGELEEALGREPPSASGEECSVLGEKLAGACEALPPALRERALAVGEACSALPALAPPSRKVPDDFQVVLRRGKRAPGLGRDPRYTLVVFRNGHVVFHRPAGAGQDTRKNGRTAESLVAQLHASIEELAWFSRKGGDFDAQRCGKDADLGDVVTVVANGRERMIPNRPGCRGPFQSDELELLAQRIAAVGGARGFGARPRNPRDPRVQIWTVTPD